LTPQISIVKKLPDSKESPARPRLNGRQDRRGSDAPSEGTEASEEQERLDALRRYGVLDTPPEEAFDRITRLAADCFDVPIALVALVDEERQWSKSCYGTDHRELDRKISFCRHAIASQEPMVVEDATADERFSGNPLVTGEEHVRFYAGAPLVTPEGGHAIGTLCVLDRKPRGFSDEEKTRLEDFAAMVMSEMEQRRARLEETVARVSSELLSGDADLDAVLALLGEAVEADRTYLLERPGADGPLARTHEWVASHQESSGPRTTQRKETLSPEAFPWWFEQLRQVEEPLHIRVSDLPPEAEAEQRYLARQDIASLLDVPIPRSDGTLYGVLGFEHTGPGRDWDRSDSHVLRVTSDLLAGYFEREQTEQALRESRDEIEELLESMSDAFFALDEDWNVTYVNDAAERVFERRREELLGQNVWEEFPEAVDTVFDEECHRAVAEGEAVSLETFFPPLDVWVEVRAYPFETGLSVFFEDISERKQAQEALRENRERLQLIAETVTEVFWVTDPQKREMCYISPAFEEIWGRRCEELYESPRLWIEAIHPEDRDRVREAALTDQAQGDYDEEFRVVRPDGEIRWVRDRAFPVRSEEDGGEVVQIVGIVQGVTARKETEERLRESEEHHRALFENTSDIITILEKDGTVRRTSPSAKRVLGCAPADVEGTNSFERIHPGDRERVREAFRAIIQAPPGESTKVQFRTRHADGSWVHLESAGCNLLDNPAVEGILVSSRDVTDSVELEAEREARERAEELLEAKTSFLNNMSHELRTPLASIIGFADVLGEESEGEQQEFAGRIAASGQRLQKTLDSILELAKLEGGGGTGRAEMTTAPTDVAAQVRAAAEVHRPAAEEKGLVLRVQIPPEGKDARAALSEGAFGRVLDNLIGNAIKFTEEGHVTVRVEQGEQEVRVEVEDTGSGIGDDFLEGGGGLFADFEQESKGLTRSHEGAGLGLAIAKRLVEQMDGTIDVESEKGEGTTFTMRFPPVGPAGEEATAGEATAGAEPPDADRSSGGEEAGPAQPRVLLVEDNANTRALVEHMLRGHCDVESAAGAEEALALAEGRTGSEADGAPLDLMLIDISLSAPEDGIELLGRLREGPGAPTAGVPAVAFTAHATGGDAERYREAGFDGHLGKPFSKDDLLEATREVLGTAELGTAET
jgi:PAS domain S-box-containing protein